MKSSASVAIAAALLLWAAACADQVGTGPAPSLASDATLPDGPSPGEEAGPAARVRCAELPEILAPRGCNGDFGSGATAACPAARAICTPAGECTSSCDSNACAQGAGHDGPACDMIGVGRGEPASRGVARCGVPCDDGTPCPSGMFCDTGIGQRGSVCIKPLPSGTVFGIHADTIRFATCKQGGAVACATGEAFGLNEARDFQGWCVCGSPPGTSCSGDSECSAQRCNADKKCGGLAGELCAPHGPSDVALLPEIVCRTSCSRATCACEPECKVDADCGGPKSGRVCNTERQTCVTGCRGAFGNGCERNMHCTSDDSSIGTCTDGL